MVATMHELNVRNSNNFRFLVCKFNKMFAYEQNLFEIMLQKSEFAHIGPEGSEGGGHIVATGTPQDIKNCPDSITGRYL